MRHGFSFITVCVWTALAALGAATVQAAPNAGASGVDQAQRDEKTLSERAIEALAKRPAVRAWSRLYVKPEDFHQSGNLLPVFEGIDPTKDFVSVRGTTVLDSAASGGRFRKEVEWWFASPRAPDHFHWASIASTWDGDEYRSWFLDPASEMDEEFRLRHLPDLSNGSRGPFLKAHFLRPGIEALYGVFEHTAGRGGLVPVLESAVRRDRAAARLSDDGHLVLEVRGLQSRGARDPMTGRPMTIDLELMFDPNLDDALVRLSMWETPPDGVSHRPPFHVMEVERFEEIDGAFIPVLGVIRGYSSFPDFPEGITAAEVRARLGLPGDEWTSDSPFTPTLQWKAGEAFGWRTTAYPPLWIEVDPDSIEVADGFPDDTYRFEFPVGSGVTDAFEKKYYIVGAGGEWEWQEDVEVMTEGDLVAHDLAQQMSEIGGARGSAEEQASVSDASRARRGASASGSGADTVAGTRGGDAGGEAQSRAGFRWWMIGAALTLAAAAGGVIYAMRRTA